LGSYTLSFHESRMITVGRDCLESVRGMSIGVVIQFFSFHQAVEFIAGIN
jgi:hypothetical protein